jgi:hypothetical protein
VALPLFLRASTPTISLIDRVIITVARVFVGNTGMEVAPSGMEEVSYFDLFGRILTPSQSKRLNLITSSSLGNDIVAAYSVTESLS